MASKSSTGKTPHKQPRQATKTARDRQEIPGVLFENHPVPMWIYDRTTLAFLEVNGAAVEKYGYSRAEFKKMTIKEILPKEDSNRQGAEIVRARPALQRSSEGRYMLSDGRVIDVEIASRALKFKGRSAALVMAQDITERKLAEVALRTSEARYREMFEDSPISLWEEDCSAAKLRLNALRDAGITNFSEYFASHSGAVTDCAGLIKVVDVNKATLILYGAKRKEDMIKSLADIFEGEPAQLLRQELIIIAEGKTRFKGEAINKTVDGRLIDIELSWSVAPGYENTLSRVIVSVIDITERKRAAAALEHATEFTEKIIETANVIFLQLDTAGNIQKFNQAAEEITGYSRAEVLGTNWADRMVPRERYPAVWVEFDRLITKGETPASFENPILTKDGKERNILWKNSMLMEAEKTVGIISFGIDITERKHGEERIRHQLEQLAALREIDQVVASSFDLHSNLIEILKRVKKELAVDATDVLLIKSGFQHLEYDAGLGFQTKVAEKSSVRVGQNIAGRVALERKMIHIPNLKDQLPDVQLRNELVGENFVSYYGVPLIAKGNVKGVLEVFHRIRLEQDQEWLNFLNTMAGQAALTIDNSQLFDDLQRSNIDLTLAYDATIEGWSHAMDLRDKETEGHTLRVAEMAMELAGMFGMRGEDIASVRRGALLHDIGKMGVPDGILLKPGALTEEEWVIMKKHPTLAFEMLSPISYIRSAIDIPYCHHEKWDGTGYPRGLKGDQIPLTARIFAVVDVWDALMSDRPYRRAWTREKVREHIRNESGTHFDPQVVELFFKMISEDTKGAN